LLWLCITYGLTRLTTKTEVTSMCRDRFGLELNPGDTIMYADGLGMDTATVINIFEFTQHGALCRVQFSLTDEVAAFRFTKDVIKVHTVQGLLHKGYPELFI
jgi:hypothetical protein